MIFQARIPSRENYVNHIEIENIDRLDTAQFFDVDSPENRVTNNKLIQICKDIFKESYEKGGKEAGAIINVITGEHAIHEATRYNTISFVEDTEAAYYHLYKQSTDYSCIVMHTHNAPSSFSLQDVGALLSDTTTIAIVVVTSVGHINMLVKDPKTDYSEILDEFESYYKTDCIRPDARKLMESKGLIERRVTTWENIH